MQGSDDVHERILRFRERLAELRAEFHEIVMREEAGEFSREEEIAHLQPVIAEMNALAEEMAHWTHDRIYGEPKERA